MLRILTLLTLLSCGLSLFAQQTLDSRIAVYTTEGERFVVDSARLSDSIVVMEVGELSFDIPEERFARLEPIPGGTFAESDQVYSLSLRSGTVVVGQVLSFKRGLLSIKTSDGDVMEIHRDDIQAVNIEKRNIFSKPHVKKCATTNFISSPYALDPKEIVFSSVIYWNSLEIGFGKGFSGKLMSSVVPFLLPTGYEFSYKKKLDNSDFSIGVSAGQIWLGPAGSIVSSGSVNSGQDFTSMISSSVTYHTGDSYLKSGVTLFSGSNTLTSNGLFLISSTYSMPGIKKPYNRWNFTANIVPTPFEETDRNNLDVNSFFLAGYQVHSPKASYTVGLGVARNSDLRFVPFPYAYFSLYGSKEQRKVSNALNMQRRVKFLQRAILQRNARERKLRKREAARKLQRKKKRKR